MNVPTTDHADDEQHTAGWYRVHMSTGVFVTATGNDLDDAYALLDEWPGHPEGVTTDGDHFWLSSETDDVRDASNPYVDGLAHNEVTATGVGGISVDVFADNPDDALAKARFENRTVDLVAHHPEPGRVITAHLVAEGEWDDRVEYLGDDHPSPGLNTGKPGETRTADGMQVRTVVNPDGSGWVENLGPANDETEPDGTSSEDLDEQMLALMNQRIDDLFADVTRDLWTLADTMAEDGHMPRIDHVRIVAEQDGTADDGRTMWRFGISPRGQNHLTDHQHGVYTQTLSELSETLGVDGSGTSNGAMYRWLNAREARAKFLDAPEDATFIEKDIARELSPEEKRPNVSPTQRQVAIEHVMALTGVNKAEAAQVFDDRDYGRFDDPDLVAHVVDKAVAGQGHDLRAVTAMLIAAGVNADYDTNVDTVWFGSVDDRFGWKPHVGVRNLAQGFDVDVDVPDTNPRRAAKALRKVLTD